MSKDEVNDINVERDCTSCVWRGEYGCHSWDCDFLSYDDLKKILKERRQQRWIPVSERMPDEDYCTGRGIQHSASVLVTIIHHANDDDVFVDMACTVDGEWQLTYPLDDDPDIPKWCEIIAWMPLPEPFERDGQ